MGEPTQDFGMNRGASGIACESLQLEQHVRASLERIGSERKQQIHLRLTESILFWLD